MEAFKRDIEFVKCVASGTITDIGKRAYFNSLSDTDKQSLLDELLTESIAEGLTGDIDKERRLAAAYDMLLEMRDKEPQQEQPKQPQEQPKEQEQPSKTIKKKRGRPVKPFSSTMANNDKEQRLKRLHKAMEGKTGKAVVIIIKAAIEEGWITEKPTATQIIEEFGEDTVSVTGYNRNFSHYSITEEEIEATKKSL